MVRRERKREGGMGEGSGREGKREGGREIGRGNME